MREPPDRPEDMGGRPLTMPDATEVEPTRRASVLGAVHSRRRFLSGAGILAAGLALDRLLASANAVEAAQVAVRRRYGHLARVEGKGAAPLYLGTEDLGGAALPARAAQPAQAVGYKPDLRTRIGQMLLVGFRGTSVDGSSPIVGDIAERHLGGVLLFDRYSGSSRVRNIASPDQVASLVGTLQGVARGTRLGAPLLVAVDQEGGEVARLGPRNGFGGTYTAAMLGAINDVGFTEAQGAQIAWTLASVGINLNLAPVVDLYLSTGRGTIGGSSRSFSADPATVTAHAAAFVRGHRSAGVRTALKHFPGQGSAAGDTHLGAVDTTGSWTERELEPFAALIADGLADAVMTAHVYNAGIDRSNPASLSAAAVDGLLRGQLGFGGVVISDDLTMGAIRSNYRYEDAVARAVTAGVDLLTIAESDGGVVARTIDVIERMVASGAIPESRIDASYARITALKANL